jgi:hypothetical protein
MRTLITICFFGAFITSWGQSGAKKKADQATREWRYELQPLSEGAQGTYLIKVWSFSKKPDVAAEQAKKNAVHGVIFKGLTGVAGKGGGKVESKPPLATDPNLEIAKADFFDAFFADGGKYMKFVTLTNSGLGAGDRMKVGKEYKVGVVVSVNIELLRKDLEAAGIIRALNSGF